jgi:hypothetical protein
MKLQVLEGGHKVAAIRERGDSFSGDKDGTMQPRLPSRAIATVYQVQKEQADHYLDHQGPLDVDSYAEALLLRCIILFTAYFLPGRK